MIDAQLRSAYKAHVAHLQAAYDAVLHQAGYGAVVLHSGSLRPRCDYDDQYWPLRILPHFAHWVPLEWADCALVVRTGRKPRLIAYRDPSFWERAPEPEWAHFADELDVIERGDPGAVKDEIVAAVSGARVALVAEKHGEAHSWGFAAEDTSPPALVAALDALRIHKTAYEVACLAEANRRAALGHRAVADAFFAGEGCELDLHLRFLSATRQDDGETPYKDIVAVGASASVLHHIHYGREAKRGPRSLLLDAGAGCRGYGSDVTRTYVAGEGTAASVFGALIEEMERMQQRLCARVAVGMPYEALHEESHRQLAGMLRALGIAKLSEDELVERGVTRKFYPHGLGHSLGLQTHDVGCLPRVPKPENPWLRNTTEISVDQVFTIEPGIYFEDSLLSALAADPASAGIDWSLVNALRPFGGIRIEDDLVVLDPAREGRSARNLTREAFATAVGGARAARVG